MALSRHISAVLLLSTGVLLGQSPCEPQPETCFFNEPARFASVEQLECGQTPDGTSYCNWTLSFDQGQFTWMHSDVGEVGGYSCDGNEVVGKTDYASYSGTFDEASGVLVWEGVKYLQAK